MSKSETPGQDRHIAAMEAKLAALPLDKWWSVGQATILRRRIAEAKAAREAFITFINGR